MLVLRRVEMWCRRQAAAVILPLLLVGWMTGESSEALTTFGKSNTQPPYKPPAPTAPPARDCRVNSDCAAIAGTSCVHSTYDAATKCLCGDNQPPQNGRCNAFARGLRHMCSESSQCMEGLVCATPNATDSSRYQDKQTLCLCDTENGYVETNHFCSDAEILKTSILAILVVSVIKKLLG